MSWNDYREYEWEAELESGVEVLVEARVYGEDTPARGPAYSHGGLPPEYRDVELTVTRESDGKDITGDVSYAKMREWEDVALEKDDEAADYPNDEDKED